MKQFARNKAMFENVMKFSSGAAASSGPSGKFSKPKNQAAPAAKKKVVSKTRAVTPSRDFEIHQEAKHKYLCEQIPKVYG